MRFLIRFAVVLALFAFQGLAQADTVSTFTITGSSLFYGMGGDTHTVSGIDVIDSARGLLQSISFTAGGLLETGIDAQYGNNFYVGTDAAHFTFSGTSLSNYLGDTFNLNGPNDLYVGHVTLASTSIATAATDPTAVTPEPSTLVLLCTGLLATAAIALQRPRTPLHW